jgi:hypothetical protein
VKIACGGSPPKKAYSRSGLSLALWLALWGVTFRVWQTQAPTQAAFFAWLAALGKILTMNNLRKRHVILVDRCCMCKCNGESVNHLLLHCDVAYALWSALFTRFGLSWVIPRRVSDLFACW